MHNQAPMLELDQQVLAPPAGSKNGLPAQALLQIERKRPAQTGVSQSDCGNGAPFEMRRHTAAGDFNFG
jgi:hypothetical protein